MSLQVVDEEQAIDQPAGFLNDDPRPANSFPFGSPDLRRLRVGRYRVMYQIIGDVVSVGHIARAETSGSTAERIATMARDLLVAGPAAPAAPAACRPPP